MPPKGAFSVTSKLEQQYPEIINESVQARTSASGLKRRRRNKKFLTSKSSLIYEESILQKGDYSDNSGNESESLEGT